jgi:hypothetical protein
MQTFFAWLKLQNSIWSPDRFAYRGWNHSPSCPLCGRTMETVHHLLSNYRSTRHVWNFIAARPTYTKSDVVGSNCNTTNSLFVRLISHQPAVLFSQNKPATRNQPAVLFSQNKSAPAISHQPNEHAVKWWVNITMHTKAPRKAPAL